MRARATIGIASRFLVGLATISIVACSSASNEAPGVASPSTSSNQQPSAPDGEVEGRSSIPVPVDVAAPPAEAPRSASGLAWRVLEPGAGGAQPRPTDTVVVHYSGWTRNGDLFDSSVLRGEPLRFRADRVIPGFAEAVQLLTPGEKRLFWLPAELAYGDQPAVPGAPAGPLTFEVQLIEILTPPPVPTDVAAAPADATTTPSGLAYRVLAPGNGGARPNATSRITVHYSGWTKDGELFDSSIVRGEPFTFSPNQVIAGWGEAVQLMTVGSKYRFWIPAELAYGDPPERPHAPAGPLTFDVELLGFE